MFLHLFINTIEVKKIYKKKKKKGITLAGLVVYVEISFSQAGLIHMGPCLGSCLHETQFFREI